VNTGTQVSHYRLVEKLGEGGMGVVYEAQDTRLGRRVAIKFLPESACQNQTSLQRFQREARAASALNHPNLCTLHDIGEHEGRPFLVMELLEGQTLKEKLDTDRITPDQLVDFSAQLADALDVAHENDIVHRDIKPANIFLTPRGQMKLLDFGLAKLNETDPESGESVTIDARLQTQPGMLMGTVAYMSPEQAKGEALDHRTDLFSLGVVIYEMATGCRPFDGETSGLILHQILTETPTAPIQVNPSLSPGINAVIDKLLEKDKELRYQSARDLLVDLKRLKRDSGSDSDVTVTVDSDSQSVQDTVDTGVRSAVKKAAKDVERAAKDAERAKVTAVGALGWLLLICAGIGIGYMSGLFDGIFEQKVRSLVVQVNVDSFKNAMSVAGIEYPEFTVQSFDAYVRGPIDKLSRIPSLSVVGLPASRRYFNFKSMPQIAEELGVDAVLLISGVAFDLETFTLRIDLLDGAHGRVMWSETREFSQHKRAEIGDTLEEIVAARRATEEAMCSWIAKSVADHLGLDWQPEQEPSNTTPTIPANQKVGSLVVLMTSPNNRAKSSAKREEVTAGLESLAVPIIGELARIPSLGVVGHHNASRAAAQSFRDSNRRIPEIAEEFQVDAVLVISVEVNEATEEFKALNPGYSEYVVGLSLRMDLLDGALGRVMWSAESSVFKFEDFAHLVWENAQGDTVPKEYLDALASWAAKSVADHLGLDWQPEQEPSNTTPTIPANQKVGSLVVLPLDVTGYSEDDIWFGDFLTRKITSEFSRMLPVVGFAAALRYRDLNKSLPEIAKELKVDALLQVSMQRGDGETRVQAELLDPTGRVMWSGTTLISKIVRPEGLSVWERTEEIAVIPWVAISVAEHLGLDWQPKQEKTFSMVLLPISVPEDVDIPPDLDLDSITLETIRELNQIYLFTAVEFPTAARYRNSNKSPTQIAEELKVDAVVVGTVEKWDLEREGGPPWPYVTIKFDVMMSGSSEVATETDNSSLILTTTESVPAHMARWIWMQLRKTLLNYEN